MPGDWSYKGEATGFSVQEWAKTLRAALAVDARIGQVSRIMDKHDKDKRIALYVDEWGTWYETPKGASALYQQNSLRDALVAATVLPHLPPPHRAREDGQHRADGQRACRAWP